MKISSARRRQKRDAAIPYAIIYNWHFGKIKLRQYSCCTGRKSRGKMKTLSEPLKSQNPKNAKPICEYNENNNNGNNTTRIIPLAYFWCVYFLIKSRKLPQRKKWQSTTPRMPDTIFQSPDPSSLFPETGTQDQDLEPGPKPRQSASDSESQTAVQYI